MPCDLVRDRRNDDGRPACAPSLDTLRVKRALEPEARDRDERPVQTKGKNGA